VRRPFVVSIERGAREFVLRCLELANLRAKDEDLRDEFSAVRTVVAFRCEVVVGASALESHGSILEVDPSDHSDSSPASVPPATIASSACTISSRSSVALGWSFASVGTNNTASAALVVPIPSTQKPRT